MERNQRNIGRALPDAAIRSKTHSNNSRLESKLLLTPSTDGRASLVSLEFANTRGLSMHNELRAYSLSRNTRVVVFYGFTPITRRSHKSTFRDRYPVIDATCVPRDFNDEGKRCVASLRAEFTSPTMYACDESNVCRRILVLVIRARLRYERSLWIVELLEILSDATSFLYFSYLANCNIFLYLI